MFTNVSILHNQYDVYEWDAFYDDKYSNPNTLTVILTGSHKANDTDGMEIETLRKMNVTAALRIMALTAGYCQHNGRRRR